MIRGNVGLFVLLCFLGLGSQLDAADLVLSSTDRLLILVPHPDDEVLCCGGVIERAVQERRPIQIVYLTYGDNNAWAFSMYRHFPVFRPKTMLKMGEVRRQEALASANVLGLPPDQLIFLGYPDYGTLTVWKDHGGAAPAYESRMTRVKAVPYASAYRPGTAYKREEILQDITNIIQTFHPTKIFVPHAQDIRPDHQALYLFTHAALQNLSKDLRHQVYYYLVHSPHWPARRGLHKALGLETPASVGSAMHWLTFPLTSAEVDKKYAALKKHRTQWAYSSRFMSSYVRTNEVFEESGD